MRKYNKEQTDYIETKKALDALEAREKELEAAFVKSRFSIYLPNLFVGRRHEPPAHFPFRLQGVPKI